MTIIQPILSATTPASRRALRPDTEPPVRHICVVGGGTAGWMTALLLANTSYGQRLRITVVESPQVGIIGVGEGSTPWLRGFFESLDIEEAEWMPACNATYKAGIRFDGWSTRPGFESYFHPFASMLDNLTMTQFVQNVHARLEGADVYAHPDRFFISHRLASECRAPRPDPGFPFDIWYGYHFDAVLLGGFLQRKAIERGVRHVPRHIHSVVQHENGDIAALKLDGDEVLPADFFVDCSGFASLLIGRTLQTGFIPFAENLFNDAAVAMPTPLDGKIMTQTVSTALDHGWAWKIPLTERFGNGYVYSTGYCTADQAETELRTRLGLLDADVQARHLKMRVGRVAQSWNRNCVANGLAQGFIEPLEATALMFVQRTAAMLADALENGVLDEEVRKRFNETIDSQFEATRDYIVCHYKTNSRTDTQYWRDNAANTRLSESLMQVLRIWMARKPLIAGLKKGLFGHAYPTVSWYALLAGMGIFPDELQPPTSKQAQHNLRALDNMLSRSEKNYPDHREFLQAIPARTREETLQLYLW